MARRSLRIWPIQGDDHYKAAADFLRSKLQIDWPLVPPREEMRVRVAEGIGRAKGKNEVVVLFKSASLRDSIRSSAYHLAGSDAGLRLDISDNLRVSLRALESVAFGLKKKYPKLKRNVKFNDEMQDLVLDVKLDENSTWRKIRPDQALMAKNSLPDEEDELEVDSVELHSIRSGHVPLNLRGPSVSGANAAPMGGTPSGSGASS